MALTGLLEQIDSISREIKGWDSQKLGELAGHHPELARLESIPRVGWLAMPQGRWSVLLQTKLLNPHQLAPFGIGFLLVLPKSPTVQRDQF